MSISLINDAFQGITKDLNDLTSKFSNEALKLQARKAASSFSKIGTELNKSFSGFESITKDLDDVIPGFDASIELLNDATIRGGVAQMSSDITELEKQLPRDIFQKLNKEISSSAATDLSAITGQAATAATGALNVIVSSGAPEAMVAALGGATKKLGEVIQSDDVKNVLKELQKIDVSEVASKLTGSIDGLDPSLDVKETNLSNELAGLTTPLPGTLSNLTNQFTPLTNELSTAMTGLSAGMAGSLSGIEAKIPNDLTLLSKEAQNAVAELSRATAGAPGTTNIVSGKITKSVPTLNTQLTNIVTTLPGELNRSAPTLNSLAERANNIITNMTPIPLGVLDEIDVNIDVDVILGDVSKNLLKTINRLPVESLFPAANELLQKVDVTQLQPVVPFKEDNTKLISELNTGLARATSLIDNGLSGVLNNALEQTTKQLDNGLRQISGVVVPKKVKNQVFPLLQNQDFVQAAKILQREITKIDPKRVLNVSQLTNELQKLNVSISSQLKAANQTITASNAGSGAIPVKQLTPRRSTTGSTAATTGPGKYSYVATEEELIVEFKSIKREITEVIIHWTETRLDQDLSVEDLEKYALTSGANIPYHYLIRRNGTLQRGLDREETGEALKNGHEKYALQFAFVGGINTSQRSRASDEIYKTKDSFTAEQMKTFKTIVRILYESKPGIQILGHNDIDDTQVDPGFDVVDYTESEFNKTIVLENPLLKGPMTAQEIIAYRRVSNAQ
jgi:hypothetical protein